MIRLLILFIVFQSFGCAQVTHSQAPAKDDRDGFRYYQQSPYLLVHSDGKGGVIWKVLYLPDTSKKMVAKPTSFLSDLDTTMEFENGVLASSKTIADAAVVPNAVISAIENVVSALVAASPGLTKSPEDNSYQVPAPYLYKIVVSDNSVYFKGGDREPTTIRVSINEVEGGE